jgi:putative membrane protein
MLLVSLFVAGFFFTGAGLVHAMGNMLGKQDKKFIIKAASGGMFEVKMGEFAQKKAANEKVKAFGQRMVADHTKANQQLMEIAKKVDFTPPSVMDKKDQKMYDKLSQLQGADFDAKYMEDMVSDHEKDIAAFKKEVKKGKNDSLKEFAQNTIPVLEQHLKMAKDVRAELKKEAK